MSERGYNCGYDSHEIVYRKEIELEWQNGFVTKRHLALIYIYLHVRASPGNCARFRPPGAGKSEPCRNVNAATAFSEEAR